MPPTGDHTATVSIWDGVADSYDAYRPRTPAALLDLLPRLAHVERPRLVVDLGSGTGLSTYAWAGRADEIIGIEPNNDMLRQAEANRAGRDDAAHVSFRAGVSHETGLPDGCVDLVTVSQALHWMDREQTFIEVGRILRPGGVLAVYDYDWPPLVMPETDLLYDEFMQVVDPIHASLPYDIMLGLGHSKEEHLEKMQQSGVFRLTREISMHSEESGDAERFIGVMVSNSASMLLQRGLATEEQLQLAAFRARAADLFAGATLPWYISYHVRFGVK